MLTVKRIVTKLFKVFGASLPLVFSLPAFANDLNTRYNLLVTALARDLYFMHYVLLAICLVIFVGVFV